MSGEHVFSKGIFVDSMVLIKGIARPISSPVCFKSLKAKVLCRRHNSGLEQVDGKIKRLTDALRNSANSTAPKDSQITLDGIKLERWCLKTEYNMLASGWFEPYGPQARFDPDPRMVDFAFGAGRIGGAGGLYVMDELEAGGDRVKDLIVARVIVGSSSTIAGFSISLLDLNLVYWLYTTWTPEMSVAGSAPFPDTVTWANAKFTHRPTKLQMEFGRQAWSGKSATLIAELTW
jgi:hypothetical protein